ncbi:MAG: hypothetical protein HIU86_01315 [Acidobacteria bacterium]|nr:hypothetical protein [Acidobacteriota bacterium]
MTLAAAPATASTAPAGGTAAPSTHPEGPGTWSSGSVPEWVRRALTAVVAVALIPEAQRLWKAAVAQSSAAHGHLLSPQLTHGVLLLVAIAAFGVLLLAVVLAAGAPSARVSGRVDLVLLLVGVVLLLGEFVLAHGVNDEGALTAKAAGELVHGRPVYGVDWPGVFAHVALTKTMGGGADYRYGYPPLAVLLTAGVAVVLRHPTVAAPLVTMGALLVATLVLWFRVAPVWRPLVVLVMLVLEPLAGAASGGSPILIAIALLVPVVLRFDRTGAGGRLGRVGVLKGLALGAACAAQQLAWFVVPFVAVALYGLRAREIGHRAAARVVVRYLAAAAGAWLLIDLPFIVTQPTAWLQGILIPLDQHAIVHGQSVVDIPYILTSGSGALDLFSTATVALLAGLVAAILLFPGRLGPAVTILPVTVFFVATRGDFAYWMEFSPLWLATLATVPLRSFQHAWRPRPIDGLSTGTKAAVAVILVLPAVVLALVGALAPAPLRLGMAAAIAVPGKATQIAEVTLTAVNTSDHAVTPHFAYLAEGGTSNWWQVLKGPATLQPGARASYTVEPKGERQTLVRQSAIIAVSDRPMTISSVRLPSSLARG